MSCKYFGYSGLDSGKGYLIGYGIGILPVRDFLLGTTCDMVGPTYFPIIVLDP